MRTCLNFSTARSKVSLMKKLRVVLRFSAPTSSNRRSKTPSCRLVVYSLASKILGSRNAGITVSQFHVEPPFMGYGSCCPCCYRSLERWRTSPRLGGFRWYRVAPVGQLSYRILRGTERRKRGESSHGFARTQGQGEALRGLARNRIRRSGSRRHDLVQNRRHCSRRLPSYRGD